MKWLAQSRSHALALDDPQTTQQRRQLIREKSFLRQVYGEWYAQLCNELGAGTAPILELGSGAGFLDTLVPNLISSDLLQVEGLTIVLDATALPFRASSVGAIVMTNVLHHIPNARCFFREADRCLAKNGIVAMIEPWVTTWSRLIYGKLHHEPFLPTAAQWEFTFSGALSGANQALPWIIFERDREKFQTEFPMFEIRKVKPLMPFRYLLSGGMSRASLMPGWTFHGWRRIEQRLEPWLSSCAMFALIVLVKK